MEQLPSAAHASPAPRMPKRRALTAAERQRMTRGRRRDRMRVIQFEISDAEIVALIEAGWLSAASREDRAAMARGLGSMLGAMPRSHWPRATGPAASSS